MLDHFLRFRVVALAIPLALVGWLADAAEKLAPAEAAKQVDRALAQETSGAAAKAAIPRIGDAGYLRRVTLDLAGRVPTADEVTLFVLDSAADKRGKVVSDLLADDEFGKTWGRYWRDVIMYRSSNPQGQISSTPLEQFLTEALNKEPNWKQIATKIITATGDVREKGETALIMAQEGKAEETTAEVARIFLGIQIQCAQCHDHPTDRWKREQFHELAAFFPRLAVRQVRDGDRRSFEVVSVNRQGFGRPGQGGRGGRTEHYMPDLDNPAARGKLMTPKFFATSFQFQTGKTDEERRATLSDVLTGEKNPWFSQAIVNRVWAEMVGEGFYEPVDDMGPDRPCSAPNTLKLLGEQFAANDHNVKWLFETIASTEAYQRESRQRRTEDETPFAANCHQRLRGDQLFAALIQVLGISEQALGGGGGRRGGGGGFGFGFGGARAGFNRTFGFDPSTPKDDVTGSIPQALFMMNAPGVNSAIDARRPGSVLGKILSDNKDDKAAVVELYLRCLSREPKPGELKTCLEHIGTVKERGEAFEDLLWALVNSTEFQHRK
jgi:hypothetical protein